MGKNYEKWLRNGDFFRFSHMATLISFKSIGALKLDLYGLLYFHTFNMRKSREENAKWEKSSLFAKMKKFLLR